MGRRSPNRSRGTTSGCDETHAGIRIGAKVRSCGLIRSSKRLSRYRVISSARCQSPRLPVPKKFSTLGALSCVHITLEYDRDGSCELVLGVTIPPSPPHWRVYIPRSVSRERLSTSKHRTAHTSLDHSKLGQIPPPLLSSCARPPVTMPPGFGGDPVLGEFLEGRRFLVVPFG